MSASQNTKQTAASQGAAIWLCERYAANQVQIRSIYDAICNSLRLSFNRIERSATITV